MYTMISVHNLYYQDCLDLISDIALRLKDLNSSRSRGLAAVKQALAYVLGYGDHDGQNSVKW